MARAAQEAHISPTVASRLENGRLDLCSFHALEAYARGLGAEIDVLLRWRGGDLDRLLNRRHSAMHERMAKIWTAFDDWVAVPEVSFSIYGERGVIDWFAWHAKSRTVLVEELKSQLVDVQELVATTDRRLRLAPAIARARGWEPGNVASWALLEDGRTNRRHAARHATFLRTAFPADGRAMRAWLRNPNGPIRCLSFLPNIRDPKPGRPLAAASALASVGFILPAPLGDERLAASAMENLARVSPPE